MALALTGCAAASVYGQANAVTDQRLISAGCDLLISITALGVKDTNLSGQYKVSVKGTVTMHLGDDALPPVFVKGLSTAATQKAILKAIAPFFKVTPAVTVSITGIPQIQVVADGMVLRKGIIQLNQGARLSDLLIAAGYQREADLDQVQITRLSGTVRTTMVVNFSGALQSSIGILSPVNNPPLQSADVIFVNAAAATAAPTTPVARVQVMGEVKMPGFQDFKPGLSVHALLEGAGGPLASADLRHLTLSRLDGTRSILDGDAAIHGIPTDDLRVSPGDVLFVERRDSGLRYAVVGEVPSPGTFDYTGPVTLSEALKQCGGIKPSADQAGILILRGMLTDPAHSKTVPVSLLAVRSGKMQDVELLPGDMVQVNAKRKQPNQLLGVGLMLLKMFVF